MICAADTKDGVKVVFVDDSIPVGSKVRYYDRSSPFRACIHKNKRHFYMLVNTGSQRSFCNFTHLWRTP